MFSKGWPKVIHFWFLEIYRSNKTKNLEFSRTNVELGNPKKADKKCECWYAAHLFIIYKSFIIIV